jgi:K+-sensing histidine kinase KdpD
MDFSKLEENAAQNRLGTGLGLSICKKITEEMKGSLSVKSKVGMGTSFTFQMITKCKVNNDISFRSLKDKDIKP